MDISSKCTGYSIVEVSNKTLIFKEIGALFRPITWTESGKYYKYLIDFIVDKCSSKAYNIEKIVAEAYFVSPFKGSGTSVVVEAIGSVKASCYFPKPSLEFESIAPQTWRSMLDIKKDDTLKGSARFKVPTKTKIESLLNLTFPEQTFDILGNKFRKTPTDLVDAVGIAMGFFKKTQGITTYNMESNAIKLKND
ncbi:MAG: hypothetical protein KDB74_07090 [Flavobacteriales bacterium]|nr:hypothetical protein [Flavobacteriales bacterium]